MLGSRGVGNDTVFLPNSTHYFFTAYHALPGTPLLKKGVEWNHLSRTPIGRCPHNSETQEVKLHARAALGKESGEVSSFEGCP